MIETKIEKIPLFLKRIKGWAGYKLQETGKKPLSVLDMKGVGPDDKDRVTMETSSVQIVQKCCSV